MRSSRLQGLEDWLAQRFRQHRGDADVMRQELQREHGVAVSLRTVERAVEHMGREALAQSLATVRYETPPGHQLQIDFGTVRVPVAEEALKVYLSVATLSYSHRVYVALFLHERRVGDVKHNAIAGHRFESLEAVDAHLARWVREVADVRVHGITGEAPLQRFEAHERAALKPLFGREPFLQLRELTRHVHSDACVEVDTNRYSVPWWLIGEHISAVVADAVVQVLQPAKRSPAMPSTPGGAAAPSSAATSPASWARRW